MTQETKQCPECKKLVKPTENNWQTDENTFGYESVCPNCGEILDED